MKATGIDAASEEDLLRRIVTHLVPARTGGQLPLRVPQALRDAFNALTARDKPHALPRAGVPVRYVPPPAPPRREIDDAELAAAERAHAAAASALRERIRQLNVSVPATHYECHWLAEWSQELDAVRDLAADLTTAAAGFAELRETLIRAPRGAGARRKRIAAAAMRLPEIIDAYDAALSDYHRLEIALVLDTMRARRADCELEARKYRELAEQEQEIRSRLYGRWWALARLAGRGGAVRRERARLGQRLHRLSRQRQRRHVFIEAHEVRRWLDTLVDASLHFSAERWLAETEEARHIFYQMLTVHCLQTSMPAERLAANILLHENAHERVVYCPATEHYLEKYFNTYRSSFSEDLEGLKQLRDTMLAEYRKRASMS